jgi:hypothetical protein
MAHANSFIGPLTLSHNALESRVYVNFWSEKASWPRADVHVLRRD